MSKEITKLSETKLTKLLSSMPPDLKEANAKLSEIMAKGQKSDILWRYDAGLLVGKTIDDESAYGESPVEKLAAVQGVAPEFLYQCRAVTQQFSRQEIVAIIEENKRVTWGHLTVLQQLSDKGQAIKLLTKISSKNWSIKELLAHVKTHEETKRKGGKRSGRNPVKPSSAAAGLKQVVMFVTKSNRYFNEVWENDVYEALENISDTQITPNLRQLVEDAKDQLERQLENTRKELESIRKIEARFEQVSNEDDSEDEKPSDEEFDIEDETVDDDEEEVEARAPRGRRRKESVDT